VNSCEVIVLLSIIELRDIVAVFGLYVMIEVDYVDMM